MRTVSYHVYVFYRHRDPAVFDEVAALYEECEVPLANLDLSVGELVYIYSLIDGRYYSFRVGISTFHIGGPHPWNRVIPEILPSSVSGRFDSIPRRTYPVVQIGGQDAVLDHVCLLSRHTFIVIIAGATVVHDGAVINDIHTARTDSLSHLVGKDGLALSVEIRFECMSHGFMQQDAGCACTHDYAHLSSFRPDCLEPCIHVSDDVGRKFLYKSVVYEFRTHPETSGSGVAFCPSVMLEYGGNRYTSHWARVACQLPE